MPPSNLHLAVMSNQRKVLRVMLQHVANIEEEEECSNALVQVLGTKTSVVFTGGEAITYDKDDRSLDGMNAFHLASKYDPKAIEVIFDILSTSHVTYSEVLELLEEKDKHLEQTPLHVAVKHSTSNAARYESIFQYQYTCVN